MTRLAYQRRVMPGVAKIHKLSQWINGTFGLYLIAFARQLSVTAAAEGRFGKTGALTSERRGVAGGALQLQRSVGFMTEGTQRESQQHKAAIW